MTKIQLTSIPQHLNNQTSFRESLGKLFSIPDKELVKKAALGVLGSAVTVGAMYLGYKKLSADVVTSITTEVENSDNGIGMGTVVVALSVIGIVAYLFNKGNQMTGKKNDNHKTQNHHACDIAENSHVDQIKALPSSERQSPTHCGQDEDQNRGVYSTIEAEKIARNEVKQKLMMNGLTDEVSEKMSKSFNSSFLYEFLEIEVSLEDIQEFAEQWKFATKLKNVGIHENVAEDASRILPREELALTLNKELTEDEIQNYPKYLLSREREILKKILENFTQSIDLADRISKKLSFNELTNLLIDKPAEETIVESIYERLKQEFVEKLKNEKIPEKAVKEASILFTMDSLLWYIDKDLTDEQIEDFECVFEEFKMNTALYIFTKNEVNSEQAKEIINLFFSRDELVDFLSREHNPEEIKKLKEIFGKKVEDLDDLDSLQKKYADKDEIESAYFIQNLQHNWVKRLSEYDFNYIAYLQMLWIDVTESNPWYKFFKNNPEISEYIAHYKYKFKKIKFEKYLESSLKIFLNYELTQEEIKEELCLYNKCELHDIYNSLEQEDKNSPWRAVEEKYPEFKSIIASILFPIEENNTREVKYLEIQ